MTAFDASHRYQALRAELREVLAQAWRWNELPPLLDRLDQARRAGGGDAGAPAGTRRAPLWVDRFAGAWHDGRSAAACAPRGALSR